MGGPELGLNLGPKNENVKKSEHEKQNLERSKPEKNNPNLGPKNVKKLELFPPRIIKKAKRQKKYTSDKNEDQPSITKFLRKVPTPDNTIQQENGTATPGSGPGLGGAVQRRTLDKIEKLEKLKPNKRKFT